MPMSGTETSPQVFNYGPIKIAFDELVKEGKTPRRLVVHSKHAEAAQRALAVLQLPIYLKIDDSVSIDKLVMDDQQ